MKKSILSTIALAGIFGATLAGAAGMPKYIGELADGQSYDREISIKPDAKWVNVHSGETVKFTDVASGRSFVWRFDTPRGSEVFDLAAVAPRGALAEQHLTAYVDQNPSDNDD